MQELPIPQLKNKNRFKTLFCQISVALLVAVTHMLLFSLFTQKYAAHRDRHSNSPATRKVFTVRLLSDSRLTPEQERGRSTARVFAYYPR